MRGVLHGEGDEVRRRSRCSCGRQLSPTALADSVNVDPRSPTSSRPRISPSPSAPLPPRFTASSTPSASASCPSRRRRLLHSARCARSSSTRSNDCTRRLRKSRSGARTLRASGTPRRSRSRRARRSSRSGPSGPRGRLRGPRRTSPSASSSLYLSSVAGLTSVARLPISRTSLTSASCPQRRPPARDRGLPRARQAEAPRTQGRQARPRRSRFDPRTRLLRRPPFHPLGARLGLPLRARPRHARSPLLVLGRAEGEGAAQGRQGFDHERARARPRAEPARGQARACAPEHRPACGGRARARARRRV